jgi:hypothetical protein
MWNNMIQKITANPHMLYPIAVQTEGDSIKGNMAEFIDLMRSNTDMQFIEQREEYRKVIGAFFGVSPIFQGDVSASGGLNNERLQIVVTNRAIERTQAVINELLTYMTNEFGSDGWKIQLVESEDRNEMNDLQLEKQKIENAILMKQLGYKVYLDEKGEFQYEYDENLNYANALSQVQYEQPTDNTKVGMDNEPISKSRKKR